MTCPDFTLSATGRRGLGVIQAFAGLDYPLVAPSDDIRYLVADFYLVFDRPVIFPLRIAHLYNVGCTDNEPASGFPTPRVGAAADIVIADADGQIVFDSTAGVLSAATYAWGSDYQVYEWTMASAICRLVVHTTWDDTDDGKKNYDKYLTPVDAVLDARAVYQMPRRVTSLRVRNGLSTSAALSGNITLRNGYNTVITKNGMVTTKFRTDTPITIAAVAGSGAGKYPCALDGPAPVGKEITRINGVSASNGDFLISASDCIWSRRPLEYSGEFPTISPTAQQQLGADCKPCAACTDYASTALYMNHVRDRYALIGSRAEAVRARHESNIARWNEYRLCSTQTPLRLILVPQRCPYMDVVLLLCNPCESCMPSSLLQLELSVTGADTPVTAELQCGYTSMFATGINGQATTVNSPEPLVYTVAFPQLQAGDSAYVKFRLKFSSRGQYTITGLLTGTHPIAGTVLATGCENTDTPASATTSQVLYCDDNGNTEMPC